MSLTVPARYAPSRGATICRRGAPVCAASPATAAATITAIGGPLRFSRRVFIFCDGHERAAGAQRGHVIRDPLARQLARGAAELFPVVGSRPAGARAPIVT